MATKEFKQMLLANECANHPQDDEPSGSDTLQWCQLHLGHCNDVVPVRRHYEDPNRQDEIFMACQSCIRVLKKADLIMDSKFAKLPCLEVIVPKGLSKGRGLELSYATQQQSFEITLEPLQAKYLRALGLRVIPA